MKTLDKILEKYSAVRDFYHGIPFGHFCYEDINPHIRHYCKYHTGTHCSYCGEPVYEFIKVCKNEADKN